MRLGRPAALPQSLLGHGIAPNRRRRSSVARWFSSPSPVGGSAPKRRSSPSRRRRLATRQLRAQGRQKLGPMLFSQEFEGEFIDAESSAFSSEMIELALVSDFAKFP